MKDENGNIVFDVEEQKKVDEIVQQRLARVKTEKPSDYEDLKEIEKELEEFGYSGTPAEKKAAIKAYKEQLKTQKELEELQEQAANDGITPELAREIRELKKDLEELKSEKKAKIEEAEAKRKQDENFNTQVAEFKEKHSEINLSLLEKDEDFIEYATGRTGSLTTLYEGYVKFTSRLKEKTSDEVATKFKVKELSSTGSGKGSPEGGDYGLSERQKELAKQNKIPYKEYAELLKYV